MEEDSDSNKNGPYHALVSNDSTGETKQVNVGPEDFIKRGDEIVGAYVNDTQKGDVLEDVQQTVATNKSQEETK